MNNIFKRLCCLCMLLVPISNLYCQNSTNGSSLSPKGRLNVFLIFAEIDAAGCPNKEFPGSDPNWPAGSLPKNLGNTSAANNWYSHTYTSGGVPSGELTRYYYEMSMGNFILCGDYYPKVVKISCNDVSSAYDGSTGTAKVFNIINAAHSSSNPIVTANGHTLDYFDNWTYVSGQGAQQVNSPDGKIDMVVVIWRNFAWPMGSQGYGMSGSFWGNTYLQNMPIEGGSYFRLVNASTEFYKAEFFHALFGGNEFHTGAGASTRTTFMTGQGDFSMTAQTLGKGAVSQVACGWDRDRLGYYNPTSDYSKYVGTSLTKQYSISAINQGGTEVPSDISIDNNPNQMTFVLRDFVKTGDAIRIRLPHVGSGPEDNQYLWLENHTGASEFDKLAWSKSTERPCRYDWASGVYSYIQVGRDDKTNFDGKGDFLAPLTAEGNYDFYYRLDKLTQPPANDCESWWGNKGVPYEKGSDPNGHSMSNPFTGLSDLNFIVDLDNDNGPNNSATYIPNGNGKLFDGYNSDIGKYETPTSGTFSVYENGAVKSYWPGKGDELDAFKVGRKINIASNPASTPVYTFAKRNEATTTLDVDLCYENRHIWLSGLSISIDNSMSFGSKLGTAYVVTVKWDDYLVNKNVRWAGNIVLRDIAEDPQNRQSTIIVDNGTQVLLDQGFSPTQHQTVQAAYKDNGTTKKLLAEPTILLVENQTKMVMNPSSELRVKNGSTFHLQEGGVYEMNSNSVMSVESTGFLCVDNPTNIVFTGTGGLINYKGGIFYPNISYSNQTISLGQHNATHEITTANNVAVQNNVNTTLVAGLKVKLEPGFNTRNLGNGRFQAYNYFPKDCATESFICGALNPLGAPVAIENSAVEEEDHSHEAENQLLSVQEASQPLVKLYPNPSKGNVKVESGNNTLINGISVYDSRGHELVKQQLNVSSFTINTSDYHSGIYFISITLENGEVLNETFVVTE